MSDKYLDLDADIPILASGFAKGYTPAERQMAEAILKRIGYEKIHKGKDWKKKPGPRSPPNQTDEEIRIRLDFLCLVLGNAAKKLSTMALLSALLELLKIHREQSSEGLYFTPHEKGRLQVISGNSGDTVAQISGYPALRPDLQVHWKDGPPTDGELAVWLAELAARTGLSVSDSWADTVDAAIAEPVLVKDEMQLYSSIRFQLGLAIEERTVTECEKEIENLKTKSLRKPGETEERQSMIRCPENDIWLNGLYDQKISRPETLWPAIARLLKIRNVLDSCRYVRVNKKIERLYAYVRCCTYRMDPRAIPQILGEIDAIFGEAIKRQGGSPFIPLFYEELEPGPSWIPEDGQLNARPPRDPLATVAHVPEVVAKAGDGGMLTGEIVNALMQRTKCSKVTARSLVTTAEKVGKIIRNKAKRYIVPPRKCRTAEPSPPEPESSETRSEKTGDPKKRIQGRSAPEVCSTSQ